MTHPINWHIMMFWAIGHNKIQDVSTTPHVNKFIPQNSTFSHISSFFQVTNGYVIWGSIIHRQGENPLNILLF